MSLGIKRKKTAVAEPKIHFSWKEAKRQKSLLIWSGIIVIYGIIFYYLPLGGWLMAFQNYRPIDGLFHSEFVGLQKFQQLFSDATFLRVIRNTLAMGVINLQLHLQSFSMRYEIQLEKKQYRQYRTCRISCHGLL